MEVERREVVEEGVHIEETGMRGVISTRRSLGLTTLQRLL